MPPTFECTRIYLSSRDIPKSRANHRDSNPSHIRHYLQSHRTRFTHSVGATRYLLVQRKTADPKSKEHPTLNPPKKSPGVRFSTFGYGPAVSQIRRSRLKSQDGASGTCVARYAPSTQESETCRLHVKRMAVWFPLPLWLGVDIGYLSSCGVSAFVVERGWGCN